MMGAAGVDQLVVQPVANGHFGYHTQVFEQMKRPIHRGDIHVWIGFFGAAKDLVHAHVSAPIGNDGEDQYPLWSEAVAFFPEGIDRLLTLYHDIAANKGCCNCLRLRILSNYDGLSRQIFANSKASFRLLAA